jgi:hypothetical protein
MSCKGLHCDGCGNGSGGGILAVIIGLVIIGAIAGPVVAAVTAVVEAVLAAAVALAALAVAAAAGYLAWRHRHPRRAPSWAADPRTSAPLARSQAAGLTPRQAGRELPSPQIHNHFHLHGLSDDQLAALINRKDPQ